MENIGNVEVVVNLTSGILERPVVLTVSQVDNQAIGMTLLLMKCLHMLYMPLWNMMTACSTFLSSAGGDYRSAPVVLTFISGDITATATISIIDDSVQESDEFFELTLTTSDFSAIIPEPGSTIIIIDNDSKFSSPCLVVAVVLIL